MVFLKLRNVVSVQRHRLCRRFFDNLAHAQRYPSPSLNTAFSWCFPYCTSNAENTHIWPLMTQKTAQSTEITYVSCTYVFVATARLLCLQVWKSCQVSLLLGNIYNTFSWPLSVYMPLRHVTNVLHDYFQTPPPAVGRNRGLGWTVSPSKTSEKCLWFDGKWFGFEGSRAFGQHSG